MKTKLSLVVVVLAASCGESRDLDALHDGVAASKVKIGDMANVAESSMQSGRAVTAELVLGDQTVYAIGTIGAGTLHDVRIETLNGTIVSSAAAGSGSDSCPSSISIAQAIAIAEAQVPGGTVIAAIPDDDVGCAREIQVLAPDMLWEVKVGGDGAVLEKEESDETED